MNKELKFEVLAGNNVDILKWYPDNHFDSIVTDPPYLINFLGKDWDSSDNDLTPTWKECLRVLKPGGHLLSFSAARTYHTLACQIEQAGFEIRDQIMWIYGSGFPKAQDMGKAIQKRMGVKETKDHAYEMARIGGSAPIVRDQVAVDVVCTDPEAQQWAGWKTQLKPAHETLTLAKKPMSYADYEKIETNNLMENIICQLANNVELNLPLTGQVKDYSALINALGLTDQSLVQLSEQSLKTGILTSQGKVSIFLNIVSLWQRIWVESWERGSKSTISMESKMTTGLRTLKYWILQNTQGITTQEKMNPKELKLYAQYVTQLLLNLQSKLIDIHTDCIVPENATSLTQPSSQGEADKQHEPIVMARKPFKGACVDNILKHGTGALNIDDSRVGDEILSYDSNIDKGSYNGKGYKYGDNADTKGADIPVTVEGRYPSNVLGEIEDHQKYFYNPEFTDNEQHEPIVMARKPFKGACVDNILKHGTGALNIDASRVPTDDILSHSRTGLNNAGMSHYNNIGEYTAPDDTNKGEMWSQHNEGRYPSNVIGEIEDHQNYFYNPEFTDNEQHEPIVMARKPFKGACVDNILKHGTGALNIDASRVHYEDEADKKKVDSDSKMPANWAGHSTQLDNYEHKMFAQSKGNDQGRYPSNVLGEIHDYQKYFYCPKVSRKERHIGFDELPAPDNRGILGAKYDGTGTEMAIGVKKSKGNNHPTVKPQALMSYLITLITPPNGKVLDPFNGSGSTGMAAVKLGFEYTGIDMSQEYVDISIKRIEAWNKPEHFDKLFKK